MLYRRALQVVGGRSERLAVSREHFLRVQVAVPVGGAPVHLGLEVAGEPRKALVGPRLAQRDERADCGRDETATQSDPSLDGHRPLSPPLGDRDRTLGHHGTPRHQQDDSERSGAPVSPRQPVRSVTNLSVACQYRVMLA